MAEGGNACEGPGKEKVGTLGEVGTSNIRGHDPTRGAIMGNNGPHPEREGEVLGYQTRRGGVEGLCNSGELLVKAALYDTEIGRASCRRVH